jgi:ATP-binding cassette subfamily C protein
MADRIVVMDAGRVRAIGTTPAGGGDDLYAELATTQFLATAPTRSRDHGPIVMIVAIDATS